MQKFMCYGTVFALFYCEFEGNFRVQFIYKPTGAYIWRGDLTEGFFALRVGGGGYIFGILR